jgi:aspartate carbamoyltransferase catalytic subunit
MPEEIIADLRAAGAEVNETTDLIGQISEADVIYMTRIQKERFPDEDEYTKVADSYKLHARDLDDAKAEMIIMHPLPRVEEIHPSVDSTRHARYFEQAFNGVVARMSLMCWLLGVNVPADVMSEGEVI